MRVGRVCVGVSTLVAGVLVAACSGSSESASSTSVAATSAAPETTAAAATSAPSTVTSAPPSTSAASTISASTTTSEAASTTSTTVVDLSASEPAQQRTPHELPPPTGYAYHVPGPEWTGKAALTGLPADSTVTSRAALAVKIDNHPEAQPQWNLANADIVFEEIVEGTTRFIAVFQTNMPDRIGPVRSARTSDIDILASLNRPILAWSGGNAGVTLAVRGAHMYGWLSNLSASNSDCYYRSRLKRAPHNLLLDPVCARQSATLAGPARPVFTHDTDAVPDVTGTSESRFTVSFTGIDVTWQWDPAAKHYVRNARGKVHTDMDGDVVDAENVVVLAIEYKRSPADPRSPEAQTVGYGTAVVHRSGVAIDAVWSRPDRFSMFTLTTPDGTPLTLTPGTTFVELTRR